VAGEIVGRADELKLIRAFLEGDAAEPRVLVLEGEAGIGKSTLWRASLEEARAQGYRVLSARPAEAERALAFAGLGDLLEPVLDDVLPSLPPPRRRALEIALLVADDPHPVDPRTIGVAVRNVLELLADAGSTVVAVDDVQWLDRSSSDALSFALRRIERPLTILLARRVAQSDAPSELEGAISPGSLERLHVGPLSVGALQTLLGGQLARVFSRPTLLRIHEASGGNPFYALELARALPHDVDPMEPLPIPATLEELVRARLAELPERTRGALALVATLGVAPVAVLRAAQFTDDALEPAFGARVLERADGELRFTHPLLASTLYGGMADTERRTAHRLLSELLEDPVAAARHRALAVEGPDASVAASLDQAAGVASIRGMPVIAAELGELARRLTPEHDPEGRHRRGILAATALLRAGDVGRAQALADKILADSPAGNLRAEALVLLSGVESRVGSPKRAIALRQEALREATENLALRAAVHQWLAGNLLDSPARVRERHARVALELAERLDDSALRGGALATLALVRCWSGEPDAVAIAEEAHAVAVALASSPQTSSRVEVAHLLAWSFDRLELLGTFTLAGILVTTGPLDRARALLDDLQRDLAPRDELLESKVRWMLGSVEIQAGRWALAADHLLRVREVTAQYGAAGSEWPSPVILLAELAIHRGEIERARELLAGCRELAEREPDALAALEAVLGIAARVSGDPEASIAHFAEAEKIIEAHGVREPGMSWWRADFVEMLLEVARVDDAVELLDGWESDARRLGRDWVIADATRCRGLVAAARCDLDVARSLLEEATRQHEQVGDPFGRARALLALGVATRRARQKSAAREAIAAALLGFEDLGEVFWTARARAELGRIGGRTREEGLTPAEQRVAALVAEGRTNREVAAALVLGERTVESHLTHIYAKLGIRSRTELARVYDHAT
jgi:DNA-binding CsgD family transcriptional regulator